MLINQVENVTKIKFLHGKPFVGCEVVKKELSILPKTYLVFDPRSRLHKIGRSTNPGVRIRELNITHNTSLDIMIILDVDVEKMLHKKYKTHQVHGEWFYLSDRIVSEIKSLAS
jgi:hypothetical protein